VKGIDGDRKGRDARQYYEEMSSNVERPRGIPPDGHLSPLTIKFLGLPEGALETQAARAMLGGGRGLN